MEIQGGWIKAYRKMLDNPVCCKDSDYFSVWMYLLLNATHKEHSVIFKGKRVILKAGQLVTGRQVIAKKFKISESKVQRILADLESEKQIEQETATRSRIIKILGWENYQGICEKGKISEQQNDFSKAEYQGDTGFLKENLNNKRTTNEQQNEQQNDFSKTEYQGDTEICTAKSEQQNEQQNFEKVNTYKNTINNSIYLNLNKKDFENVKNMEEFKELIKDLPYVEQLKAQSEYLAEKFKWRRY